MKHSVRALYPILPLFLCPSGSVPAQPGNIFDAVKPLAGRSSEGNILSGTFETGPGNDLGTFCAQR